MLCMCVCIINIFILVLGNLDAWLGMIFSIENQNENVWFFFGYDVHFDMMEIIKWFGEIYLGKKIINKTINGSFFFLQIFLLLISFLFVFFFLHFIFVLAVSSFFFIHQINYYLFRFTCLCMYVYLFVWIISYVTVHNNNDIDNIVFEIVSFVCVFRFSFTYNFTTKKNRTMEKKWNRTGAKCLLIGSGNDISMPSFFIFIAYNFTSFSNSFILHVLLMVSNVVRFHAK